MYNSMLGLQGTICTVIKQEDQYHNNKYDSVILHGSI